MKDAKRPLEVAVANALSAIDIYDVAPDDATYPFTDFGTTIEAPDFDKTAFGQEIIITLNIRDRFQNRGGRKQINDIKNTIETTLITRPENYLSVSGFNVTGVIMEDSNSQKIDDDTYLYYTEILRIRFRLYET